MPHQRPLRIVIVAPEVPDRDLADAQTDGEVERSRSLRIGLLESGYNIVAVLPADAFLPERLAQIAPDMIIVDAESQARDTLEHVVMATRDERRPIVLFTNDDDTSQVGAAIAAGVTAYVVAGLAPDRIRPVLEVAMARFQHEESLRRELADARTQLSERKTIDRAKGMLMARHGLTEDRGLRPAAQDSHGPRHEAGRGGPAHRRRGRPARLSPMRTRRRCAAARRRSPHGAQPTHPVRRVFAGTALAIRSASGQGRPGTSPRLHQGRCRRGGTTASPRTPPCRADAVRTPFFSTCTSSSCHDPLDRSGRSAMTRRTLIKAAAASQCRTGLVPGLQSAVYAQGSDKPEKEEVRIGFIPLTDCASW